MRQESKMTEFARLRRAYHKHLCREVLGYRGRSQVLNIADSSSRISADFSKRMVDKLCLAISEKDVAAQTIGQKFAEITAEFLEKAFRKVEHLRPGQWVISTSQASAGIMAYDQYEHLNEIQRVLNLNPELKTALGGDYLITPDIIVGRKAEDDEAINRNETLVDEKNGLVSNAPLRAANVGANSGILHASISCKWTIRSDRAQNTRTEALNLIRNRKGNAPHIVAVTFEPLPGRLASLALGTGDIDCMYHVALSELVAGIEESGQEGHIEQINQLIHGRRLRDISDLPLDLAV